MKHFTSAYLLVVLACASVVSAASASTVAITQLISANKLHKIRSSLPRVAYQGLQDILNSDQTLWYNDEVMAPSYQDSVGAASNETWPDLVAGSEAVITGLYDRGRNRWQFPFATTAGTDNSTNVHIENFVAFGDGGPNPILIERVVRNDNRYQWDWIYPVGTVFGEVIFIKDGDEWLPAEIRTRKKYPSGWGMNVFRPFPTAESLVVAIRKLRPDYMMNVNLSKLVRHLENDQTLEPKTLSAKAKLSSTFSQEGWVDSLPDFTDSNLVRKLLRNTEFVAAYGTAWKSNGSQVTYAATTNHSLSVVPNHYDAGLLEVTDAACMRCHRETGRLVSEFYSDLYLYGELWGKDGIFSFHPYDESLYSKLRHSGSGPGGFRDNRAINPLLEQMGIFRMRSSREVASEIEEVSSDKPSTLPFPIPSPGGVTYSRDIRPILDRNCTECHTGGIRGTDLSRFPFPSKHNLDQMTIVSIILAKTRGTSASMPPGVRPRLTDSEVQKIQAWKDGGLKP